MSEDAEHQKLRLHVSAADAFILETWQGEDSEKSDGVFE